MQYYKKVLENSALRGYICLRKHKIRDTINYKFLGYDGVKYYSTFDRTAFNLVLFDVTACDCIYCKWYSKNRNVRRL